MSYYWVRFTGGHVPGTVSAKSELAAYHEKETAKETKARGRRLN